MKNLYYYANNIYQYSYALPVYDKLGGTFIVYDRKKWWQFKMNLKNRARFGEKNFLNTPEVIIVPRREVHKLEGVIFFLSNSIISHQKYDKAVTLFHEHGTSDKLYGGGRESAKRKLAAYDYILLSGEKNKKRIEEIGLQLPVEKLIQIGGLRFDEFLDGTIKKEEEMDRLGIRDRTRKNILYAPTWSFGNGTFEKYAMRFAEEITPKHNLIIRPHYHDRAHGTYVKLMAGLKGIRHLYLSQAANLIKSDTLRDFIVSDLMISDVSSVIYEYLITRNPMIIAQNDFEERHQMPSTLNIMDHVDIYTGRENILEMVDENLASQKYRRNYDELLHNCFYNVDGCVDIAVDFIRNLMKD
ncbi:MAG: CDP-glycerol glycerophosphotransferase family protein [Candidatus Marinimicrobia bacterium]|nr:CDP-glycerol glycerophosphotransferase family protein [Candidatus Neomarinimicrobiota bacterium]